MFRLHCLYWALIKHRQQHITNRFTALLYQQHYSTNNHRVQHQQHYSIHRSLAKQCEKQIIIKCSIASHLASFETNQHQIQRTVRNKASSSIQNTVRNKSASTTKDTTQHTSIKYKAQRATKHHEIQSTVRITSLSIRIESQLAASAIPLLPRLAHSISIAFIQHQN